MKQRQIDWLRDVIPADLSTEEETAFYAWFLEHSWQSFLTVVGYDDAAFKLCEEDLREAIRLDVSDLDDVSLAVIANKPDLWELCGAVRPTGQNDDWYTWDDGIERDSLDGFQRAPFVEIGSMRVFDELKPRLDAALAE